MGCPPQRSWSVSREIDGRGTVYGTAQVSEECKTRSELCFHTPCWAMISEMCATSGRCLRTSSGCLRASSSPRPPTIYRPCETTKSLEVRFRALLGEGTSDVQLALSLAVRPPALSTHNRGRGVLRTSPVRSSPKFRVAGLAPEDLSTVREPARAVELRTGDYLGAQGQAPATDSRLATLGHQPHPLGLLAAKRALHTRAGCGHLNDGVIVRSVSPAGDDSER